MIKYTAALIAAMSLAACSGGSSGGSTPSTPTPTTQYTATIRWTGQLSGSRAQARVHGFVSRPMAITTTTGNILLAAPDSTSSGMLGVPNGSGNTDTVTVAVSPQPSATPSVVFTTTSNDAVIQPTPATNPNATASPAVYLTTNVVNAVESGKAVSATVGSPLNTVTSNSLIIYAPFAFSCYATGNNNSAEPTSGGIQWNGTTFVAQADPTQADLYLTGPTCTGAYQDSSTTSAVLHIPGGGVFFSSNNAFDSLVASSWSNGVTSAPLTTVEQVGSDGVTFTDAQLVFHTRSGVPIKLNWLVVGTSGAFGFAYATL